MSSRLLILCLSGCGRIGFDTTSTTDTSVEPALMFDLTPGCAGLQFARDAQCEGTLVHINHDTNIGTEGGAYVDHQVSITHDLHVQLQLRIHVVGGQADGVAFVIHADPRGTGAVSGGAGLGLSGIKPSISIEFDTYNDGPGPMGMDPDPDANHVGYDKDGDTVSFALMTAPFNLSGGTPFRVWIDYTAATGMLATSIGLADIKPAPILDRPVSGAWLADPVWLGIVGGSGPGFDEAHDVLAWSIR